MHLFLYSCLVSWKVANVTHWLLSYEYCGILKIFYGIFNVLWTKRKERRGQNVQTANPVSFWLQPEEAASNRPNLHKNRPAKFPISRTETYRKWTLRGEDSGSMIRFSKYNLRRRECNEKGGWMANGSFKTSEAKKLFLLDSQWRLPAWLTYPR